jgi:hypothetical protein
MSVSNAFERQRQILGSTSVFEMVRPNGWTGFGIVRACVPWFFSDFAQRTKTLTFVFLNQDETEAAVVEAAPSEGMALIEKNKYFGYVFILDEPNSLACYYETLEGIGFVTVSPAWTSSLTKMRAKIDEATEYLNVELKAVEHWNDRSLAYAAKLKELIA